MTIIDSIVEQAKTLNKRIVFPESTDERILKACRRLVDEHIAIPCLIGDAKEIETAVKNAGISMDGFEVRDPQHDEHIEEYVEELVRLRSKKGVDKIKAKKILKDKKYFSAMMVRLNHADGCVTGATHPTSETIRPAVQILKTKEQVSIASSYFLMTKDDHTMFYADCGFVVDPNAGELGDIAIATADSAKAFGFEPKVALLSFSTHGSADHDMVTKVRQAREHVNYHRPEICIDGDLQFDAAFVPKVAASKCPDSPLKGEANIFIFPELNAGNICYKVTQRVAGYQAIGPILQGLNKPMNDLSRGCSADDIVLVAAITAIQAK